MKEDFFSKFKDYNKELEKILDKKDFSKEVKSLLLSMFYKIDIAYNDYFLVKRNCKTKQEYLENILENIKSINNIKLIKTNNNNFKEIDEKVFFATDLKLKKIETLPNELSMLASILDFNNLQIHLKEEYNLIRNSMPYIFGTAYDMENIEVIRDFNAWSWNAIAEEIKDIKINLIYQNLKIALNKELFTQIEEKNIDVIRKIKDNLIETYSKSIAEKIMELIFKISITIYIQVSENERKRLSEEKENILIDLNEIKNKKTYIEKIIEQKKKLNLKLKEIDLTINSKELLLKEYEKRNKSVKEYNKVSSISELTEKLQKERKKLLNKINECNKAIEPKIYLENRNKLQIDYDLLQDINFNEENNIYKYIDELQEIFIKDIFIKKVECAVTKEEIIDCVYELRYYNFLQYNDKNLIKDIENFKDYLETVKEKLIRKLYDNKIINTISTSEKNDIEIVKNIFDLKIINMEHIYFELIENIEDYTIRVYDEKETLETEFKIKLNFSLKDKIKLNRKVKLFI